MLAIPAPIVVALLLLVVVLMSRERLISMPSGRLFMALLLMYALGLTFIGLRWSFAITALLPLHFLLSTAWCVLAWLAFRSLSREGPVWILQQDWPHALPCVAVMLVIVIDPTLVDFVVVPVDLFYAALLARLAWRGPDALRMVRLSAAKSCHRALWVTACLLFFFAVIEVAITLDFVFADGQHAALIVGLANIPSILLLGWAALDAGQARSQEQQSSGPVPTLQSPTVTLAALPASKSPSTTITTTTTAQKPAPSQPALSPAKPAADPVAPLAVPSVATPVTTSAATSLVTDDEQLAEDIMPTLHALLVQQALYADPELNLQRLARKAGVPSRQVSRAVNSQTGQNVSQWVNAARIEAACTKLVATDDSITAVMMAVGFTTKSNFNREFRRITGQTPSAWRAAKLKVQKSHGAGASD